MVSRGDDLAPGFRRDLKHLTCGLRGREECGDRGPASPAAWVNTFDALRLPPLFKLADRTAVSELMKYHRIAAQAVHIITNSPRTDNAVLGAKSGDTPNRKSIPPVNVWHRQRVRYDPGQRGNVRDLLHRLLFHNLSQQALICEHQSRHTHARLVGGWNLPAVVVDLPEDV